MNNSRFEVWGAPIRHSRSPALHQAAYSVLGLEWEYRASHVDVDELQRHFHTLSPHVGGLSLTMPLKEGILELVSDHRGPVDLLHAANTVVRGSDGDWWLDNTDWWGAWRTLQDAGGIDGQRIWLLGAGATARAVLYALSQGAPESVTLVVRSVERARVSHVLGETLGLRVDSVVFDELGHEPPHWVISSLPGGVVPESSALEAIAGQTHLFDIAYDPWPSALAHLWGHSEYLVMSGLPMLVYQALGQIRAFVGGDSTRPLEREDEVVQAMWQAVGLDGPPQPVVKQ